MKTIKRDYTRFFTIPETAKFMAELLDPKDGDVVLEPSAGNGALVRAVLDKCKKAIVFAFEIDSSHKEQLGKSGAKVIIIRDFLLIPVYAKCTSCIANTPFGNGTDLQAHFDRIREHVKVGGKIVMIVPDDFEPRIEYNYYRLENWGTNKDGTVTPIKIIEFLN